MLRLLTPADQSALESFLSRHAASTMFLRSNLRASGIGAGDGPFHGIYAARFDGAHITDVAAHFWTGNIILFAPTSAADLAVFVATHLAQPVKGFLGPWAQCVAALDALALRHRARDLSPEDLFQLDLEKLIHKNHQDVSCRRAQTKDFDVIVQWRINYEIETLVSTPGPDVESRAHDNVKHMIDRGDFWVATIDDVPVSLSGINARLPDMVQVGGVHTPKHLRGRGYSKIAVAGSLLDCRAEGARTAILFTEAKNLSAKRVYTALGFLCVGDYGLVLLD